MTASDPVPWAGSGSAAQSGSGAQAGSEVGAPRGSEVGAPRGSAADVADGSERPSWWRRSLRRVADALEPEPNPAGAIYGTITAGTLLAAESAGNESTPDALGAVVLALILYWLAHAYAGALGERLEHDHPFRLTALLHELRRSAAIVRGSTLPLAAMVIAWAAGATTHHAVLAALFVAAASLVMLELIAALRAVCSRAELITQVGLSALLGLGILALKVLLH